MNPQSKWNLPEEITAEIISRLPSKSVGQCRCVCKSWRALLSRLDFIKGHLHRSRNLLNDSLWLYWEQSEDGEDYFYYHSLKKKARPLFKETSVPAMLLSLVGHPNTWAYIHGSCDGLLLVGDRGQELFVVNPVTKQLMEVPVPFPLVRYECDFMYGFGYDSVTDDHKIVCVCYSYNYLEYEDEFGRVLSEVLCSIYSLKSGTWKGVEGPRYDDLIWRFTPGTFVGGCIHWLAMREKEDKGDFIPTIVAFDLGQEKFHEVAPPSSDEYLFEGCDYYLVELGGWLCTFHRRVMDVWVMREYGVEESWTKVTVVASDDDDDDDELVDEYNLSERILEEVEVDICGIHATLRFIESLVSPHGHGCH